MSLIEIKSVKITEKGQISIPKRIRELEGFKEGSQIAILAYEDHIELRSMEQLSDGMETAIASEQILAKEWERKEENEAWKDL